MEKKLLIGGSICAIVLLVLGSLTNVVGYQTVHSSNQSAIPTRRNQMELLYNTLIDLANNRGIRGIVLQSQASSGGFVHLGRSHLISDALVVTKDDIKHLYIFGLVLSKILGKSRIHSMVERYRFVSQGMQKEITGFIEKDDALSRRMAQLSTEGCECENADIPHWNFPILCTLLMPLLLPILFIGGLLISRGLFSGALIGYIILQPLIFVLTYILGCWWVSPPF
jgi:hypothetical protein